MRVNCDLLVDILGATDDGPPFERSKTTVTYDPDWVF